MIVYEDGEQFNVPSKWLADHDKQIKDEVIEDIIQEMDILNQQGKGLDDLLVYLQKVRGGENE